MVGVPGRRHVATGERACRRGERREARTRKEGERQRSMTKDRARTHLGHNFLKWRWSLMFATPLSVLTMTLVMLAPFTKVEESFPLQAVNDIMYNIDTRLEILSYIRPSNNKRREYAYIYNDDRSYEQDNIRATTYSDGIAHADGPDGDETKVSAEKHSQTSIERVQAVMHDHIDGDELDGEIVIDATCNSKSNSTALRDVTLSVPGVFCFSIRQLKKFDHEDFPGVVRRTFIPSLFIALIVKPFVTILDAVLPSQDVMHPSGVLYDTDNNWSTPSKSAIKTFSTTANKTTSDDDRKSGFRVRFHERSGLEVQKIARSMVALVSIGSLLWFARSYARRLGSSSAATFLLMLSFQFHLPFYISRTLPNTFAASLIWIAISFWLRNSDFISITVLAFAGLVVRCDTILIVIPMGILMVFVERIRIVKAVAVSVVASLSSIAASLAIDSWFWGRWCWPEMEVLLFNTIQNRSGDWGVSPWHWYFTSALPRSLLFAYPLAPIGAYFERRVRPLFWVSSFYVVAYSFLPHKELRFLLPILPLLTACAAPAAIRIWHNRKKSYIALLIATAVYCGFSLCSIAILFFAAASIRNYPGGISIVSLHSFHAMTEHNSSLPISTTENVSVHIDVLPAMTGVTQFLQRPDWGYSKMEGLSVDDFQYTHFTYLLNGRQNIPGYVCAGVVKGFSGVQFQPSARNLAAVFFRMKPFVYIHERAQAHNSDGDDIKYSRQSRLKDVIVEHTQELTFNEDYIEVCEK